jgi:hypothetical protein
VLPPRIKCASFSYLAFFVSEASLRGHLDTEGDEQTGSQSYIPPDPKDDKALHIALDLTRGMQKNSACLDLQALPCPYTGTAMALIVGNRVTDLLLRPDLDWDRAELAALPNVWRSLSSILQRSSVRRGSIYTRPQGV